MLFTFGLLLSVLLSSRIFGRCDLRPSPSAHQSGEPKVYSEQNNLFNLGRDFFSFPVLPV